MKMHFFHFPLSSLPCILPGAATAVLFFLFSAFLPAQTVLNVRIANLPAGAEVMVEPWYGDRWQQGDVLPLRPDGSISVEVAAAAVGQYRLRTVDQPGKWADFIWPDPATGDSVLTFDLDYNTLNAGAAKVTGSRENDAYQILRLAHSRLQAVRDQQPEPATANTALAEFNRDCRSLARQYPGTFTAAIVCNLLYEPRPADYAADPKAEGLRGNPFFIAYGLDKIPFGSAAVLRHNGLVQNLNRYLLNFGAAPDEAKSYIDGIMSRRNGNEEVDGFLFNFLLAKMLDLNNEPGLQHLLTVFPPDCSDDSPLPDATRNMVQALQACRPGQEAPALQLPGPDGQPIALHSVATHNKLTLLFVWRTSCEYCEAMRPVLMDLYRQYHPLGLEIYAICLDREAAEWQNHLRRSPTPWLNVFVPAEQRQSFSRSIPVPGTPTLISVNNENHIVDRLIARQKLEAYVKETLK